MEKVGCYNKICFHGKTKMVGATKIQPDHSDKKEIRGRG